MSLTKGLMRLKLWICIVFDAICYTFTKPAAGNLETYQLGKLRAGEELEGSPEGAQREPVPKARKRKYPSGRVFF